MDCPDLTYVDPIFHLSHCRAIEHNHIASHTGLGEATCKAAQLQLLAVQGAVRAKTGNPRPNPLAGHLVNFSLLLQLPDGLQAISFPSPHPFMQVLYMHTAEGALDARCPISDAPIWLLLCGLCSSTMRQSTSHA